MKERPIPFTPENTRKIRAGEKWQTRRVIEGVTDLAFRGYDSTPDQTVAAFGHNDTQTIFKRCPYGAPGDQLWVREAWATVKWFDDRPPRDCHPHERPPALWYKSVDVGASLHSPNRGKWRHARFMPRWASQLLLTVTDVKVERLHRIGEESAKAEGVAPEWVVSVERGESYQSYCVAFVTLWDAINGESHPWSSNPWVWAITFEVVK